MKEGENMNAYEEYMRQVTQPMRRELTESGFTELTTADEVNEFMTTVKGTTLVVINSVCGCAAGLARPAARQAVEMIKPDHLVTVFAGQDAEATATMRAFFEEVPPSSPSMAILKDGELAYFVPRVNIEGFPMEQIRDHIADVLKQVCAE